MRLLSTKILSPAFKDRLMMHSFSLVEQSFIKIVPIDQPIVAPVHDALIFTSQNAVKGVLSDSKIRKMIDGKIGYCVGKKTATLLTENGQKVAKIARNSSELAHFLSKNAKNQSFSYFCGNLRTPDLEEVLPANGIEIQAIEIYKTQLLDHVVKGHFDGLLFFSPSAVRAYAQRNTFDQSHSFCLGTSTAKAVALHTQDYTIAKAPDEAQLLKSLINHTIRYEE